MTTPYRVQWYEGMLLEPHHFQQADLYQAHVLQRHKEIYCPYFEGVLALSYNEVQLSSGILSIDALQAILPDGTLVEYEAEADTLLQLDLNAAKKVDFKKPQRIYLCLVKQRSGAANLYDDYPRYSSIEKKAVVDENSGQFPIAIPYLKPKLHLVVGGDVPKRYSAIPLLEVRQENEKFSTTSYVPPMPQVHKSSALNLEVSKVAKKIRQKLDYLASRQARGGLTGEKLTSTVNEFLNRLNPVLPKLEILLISGVAHPFQLYQELASIAGHMATLSADRMCPAPVPYDHYNLGRCYKKVLDFIIESLSNVREYSFALPFNYEKELYSLEVNSAWQFEKQWVLSFECSTEVNKSKLKDWIESAIITTDTKLEVARETRVLGEKREILQSFDALMLPEKERVLYVLIPAEEEACKKLIVYNTPQHKANAPHTVWLQAAVESKEETNDQ